MARTIADVIGQGWKTGRAIGNDFSDWRFRRGEAKLQEEFEQRAAAENQPMDSYLEEYEQRLHELHRGSGAAKRGVTGPYGRSLTDSSLDGFQQRAQRGAGRDASRMAIDGDIAGSRGRLAQANANFGDYDNTISNLRAQGQIEATTGAISDGPMGGVDQFRLSQGIATNAARFGDAAGASAAQTSAESHRYQIAGGIFGQIAQMAPMAGQYKDEIKGLFEGVKQYIPMARNIDVEVNEAGNIVWFMGGNPMGELDDPDEAMELFNSLARNPADVLPNWEKAQTEQAASQGEYDRETDKHYRELRGELYREYMKAGVEKGDVDTLLSAQQKLSGSGWKFLNAGDDGTLSFQMGNDFVQVVPGRENVEGGERLPGFTIMDSQGNPVNPADLNDPQAVLDFAMAARDVQANANEAVLARRLLNTLELVQLDQTGQGPTGGGEIQSFPFKETDDYVRKILGNAGRPPDGTPEEQAAYLLDALVQQESGGDPNAVSPKGATGLTQLMPNTAADPGYGVQPLQNESPEEYLRFGKDYLAAMIREFGDVELGLAAYNAGPGVVSEWLEQGVVGRSGGQSRLAQQAAAGAPAAPTQGVPTAPTAALPGGPEAPAFRPEPAAPARSPIDPETAIAEVQQAEERLRRFNAENPKPIPRISHGKGDSRAAATVRKRLEEDLQRARQTARAAQATSRARSALDARGAREREAEELYARYTGGGAAAGTAPDPVFDRLVEEKMGRTIR